MLKPILPMRVLYHTLLLLLLFSIFLHPSSTRQISSPIAKNNSLLENKNKANTGYQKLAYVFSLQNATFSGRWIQSSGSDLGSGNGIITIDSVLDYNVSHVNITFYDKSQKEMLAEFHFSKEKDSVQINSNTKRHTRDNSRELISETSLTQDCGPADIDITFFNLNTGKELILLDNQTSQLEPNDIGIMFHLNNPECNLDLLSTILTSIQPASDPQIWPYTVVMCLLACIQCLICHQIQNYFRKNPTSAIKTSPWTFVLLQTFDLYIAISNATSSFATPAVFLLVVAPYVILSIYFEMKLIFEIFVIQTGKYSYYERIKLFRSKCIEAIITLTAVSGISLTLLPELAVFAVACSLIPQITETFISNKKARRYLWTLLGLFLPKLAFIGYVQFYEGALTDQTTSTLVISIAAGLLLLQFVHFFIRVMLLLIQSRFPRFTRNPQNPYHCSQLKESIHSETTCSICLYSLKEKPVNAQDPLLPSEQPDSEQTNSEIAVTLCNHEFHEVCLKGWLSNKLTCPYCRNQLPPLVEEDI